MKSITQIFKNSPDLKDNPEVQELIEYCQELESQVMENTQEKVWDKEDKLAEVVRDIFSSCKDLEERQKEVDRWPNDFKEPDYKGGIARLKEFIAKFARDNNFRL